MSGEPWSEPPDDTQERLARVVKERDALKLQIGELEHKLEHLPDEIVKYWAEGFEKVGFILHRGLTPEQNAAEWKKQMQRSRPEEPEAFVVQLCHGDKADGLYYDGDGDFTNFENAHIYYSREEMERGLREAKAANEDSSAEAEAFAVLLSRR